MENFYIRVLTDAQGHYGYIMPVKYAIEGNPVYQESPYSPEIIPKAYEIIETVVCPSQYAKRGHRVILKNLCAHKDIRKKGLALNTIYKVVAANKDGSITLNHGATIKRWQYSVVSKYKRNKDGL